MSGSSSKKPWPDFLTFYATASGAGWIVPKKYVEKVGETASRRRRSAPDPTSSSRSTPGVELVFEAFDGVLAQSPERQARW